MKIIRTDIPDLLIITPEVHHDERGYFMETFNQSDWKSQIGSVPIFIQENHSHSVRNVLRGLHYQTRFPQGKLVRVVSGEVYDVAVDLRPDSKTFGKHVGLKLNAENKWSFYIPPGFAHGFLVLSDSADLIYQVTNHRSPEHEKCIRWDDPTLNIPWPIDDTPIVSTRDQQGLFFKTESK